MRNPQLVNRIRRSLIAEHQKLVWRKAQRIRTAALKEQRRLFSYMVAQSVDVMSAPRLGSYTVYWKPLSESWVERKGFDEFYIDKGKLAQTLLRRHARSLFGEALVYIDTPTKTFRVRPGPAPVRFLRAPVEHTMIRIVPFPDLDLNETNAAEAIVSDGDTVTYGKLTKNHRPLVTPFMKWWVQIHMRRLIEEYKL